MNKKIKKNVTNYKNKENVIENQHLLDDFNGNKCYQMYQQNHSINDSIYRSILAAFIDSINAIR
jgi:hypothetical protein